VRPGLRGEELVMSGASGYLLLLGTGRDR